jgi:glutathione S-transferase
MSDPARFELFSFWRTSATYRVRVAFNLKGVQPQEHNVNLDAAEQRSEAFLKINPMGAIPALLDHGDHGPGVSRTPLTQSLAILEFLDERIPPRRCCRPMHTAAPACARLRRCWRQTPIR